ncbi:MAG: 5'-3' exonuclease [Bacteroidota bacterium]
MARLSYNGKNTGVIFSFMRRVMTIALELNCPQVVFAWDSKHSHRKRRLSCYKEKVDRGKSKQEEITDRICFPQFHEIRDKILPRLGFQNSFRFTGFEADDIIATITTKNGYALKPVSYIVSADQDLYQLIREGILMYHPSKKELMGLDDFCKKYNLIPEEWTSVKALAGCSSDNVPGIPGVGEKTAIKYLKGELTKGKVFERIVGEEGQHIYRRNYPLVALPFESIPEIKLVKDELDLTIWSEVFLELGFVSLLKDGLHQRFVSMINKGE